MGLQLHIYSLSKAKCSHVYVMWISRCLLSEALWPEAVKSDFLLTVLMHMFAVHFIDLGLARAKYI